MANQMNKVRVVFILKFPGLLPNLDKFLDIELTNIIEILMFEKLRGQNRVAQKPIRIWYFYFFFKVYLIWQKSVESFQK